MSFPNEICVPFLLQAQNADGGWSYRSGLRSATEPTGWVLLALEGWEFSDGTEKAIQRGCEWLAAAQLPDGSWPAVAEQKEGCWVTALACLALRKRGAADRGIRWLAEAWPGEGGVWWRVRSWLRGRDATVGHDTSLRGWSWTRGTSSWVEPTAYALLAVRAAAHAAPHPLVSERRQMAEAMLLDRVCPGGGWNCGNPMVYGSPGQPLVGPTVWALLALQESPQGAEIRQSLDWLERRYSGLSGPGSLALAHLGLRAYGRVTGSPESALLELYPHNEFFHQVPVVAWALLALGPQPDWLGGPPTVTVRGGPVPRSG